MRMCVRSLRNDVTFMSPYQACLYAHACAERTRVHGVSNGQASVSCILLLSLCLTFSARVGVHGCYAQACKTPRKTLRMRHCVVSLSLTHHACKKQMCLPLSFLPADSCVRI
jgi:hypothetical protein